MLWGLIALYGIGGAMAGMFPTEGRKHVLPGLTEDRAHHYGGVLSYAAILSLLVITPCFLSKRSDWRSWRWSPPVLSAPPSDSRRPIRCVYGPSGADCCNAASSQARWHGYSSPRSASARPQPRTSEPGEPVLPAYLTSADGSSSRHGSPHCCASSRDHGPAVAAGRRRTPSSPP